METQTTIEILKQDQVLPFKVTKDTLLSLTDSNILYDREHTLTEQDIEKVNEAIEAIRQQTLTTDNPRDGERIRLIGYKDYEEKSVIYENGLIEKAKYGLEGITFCTDPYVPFIFIDSMSISSSGGYWGAIKKDTLKMLGYVKGDFKMWGHNGAKSTGSIYFQALVKYWQYIDKENIY